MGFLIGLAAGTVATPLVFASMLVWTFLTDARCEHDG